MMISMKQGKASLLLTTLIAAGALTMAGCASAHDGAAHSSASGVDLTNLPLGDGHVTTSGAKRGYVFRCGSSPGGGGGAFTDGPWIKGGTYDLTAKATVDGSASWDNAKVSFTRKGGKLKVSGNGLPVNTPTGVFPISSSDDAFKYDRNPNSIKSQAVSYSLTSKPKKASKATCLGAGPIGIARNGVAIFDGLDAQDRDAVAHEVQDSCAGHPQQSGVYHYHSLSPCLFANESKTKPSKLFGYALDGFPIYGPRGAGGSLLTDDDLDACHGRTETVKSHGKRVRRYVYHATYEYPYTLGCFSGTAAKGTQGSGQQGPPGGGPPPGGPPPGGPPPA